MKEKQLIKILDHHIDEYLNNIAVELENPHDQCFDSFGFPIFGETSKDYHEQVYFQSYLESYTRKMINAVLKDILDEEVADEIVWPEFEFNGIYSGYTNVECEKEFGFEFINRDRRIGYKYCFFHGDEIDGLLNEGNVDRIVLVLWENKENWVGFSYGNKPAKPMLLWDLFFELFDELNEEEVSAMYDLFTSRIEIAVEKANAMISLTTLPGFTPSYLYKMRSEIVDNMKKDVESLKCFYVKDEKYKKIEDDSRWFVEKLRLPQTFIKNNYEDALVGTTDFAKSYMTSEYLYQYFKGNPMFDYTPVVSGYIKSIEQLLHAVCSSYLKKNFLKHDLSNCTLGGYTKFVRKNNIFVNGATKKLANCLDSYRIESRNHLFHKDYLNSWDVVETIRKNTLFLYVVILGAVEPSIITNDPSILGLLNIEYDKFFQIIDACKNEKFTFILDGKTYSNMEKELRVKGLEYDENGSITNTIGFYTFGHGGRIPVEVTRTRMPSEVWKESSGKKIKLWPINQ